MTRTLPTTDPDAVALVQLNARVLQSFGLVRGVSHTEFIRAHGGGWHFLETSSRVGGAFIVDVVEAATGVNLWREWARIEIAGEDGTYEPPPRRDRCGGIVLSLARQEAPDMSAYTDPEIVVRIRKSHHAGLIVASATAIGSSNSSADTPTASTSTSTPRPRHLNAQPTDTRPLSPSDLLNPAEKVAGTFPGKVPATFLEGRHEICQFGATTVGGSSRRALLARDFGRSAHGTPLAASGTHPGVFRKGVYDAVYAVRS